MTKYNFEFKKKLVKAYITGELSYDYTKNKYSMPSSSRSKREASAYSSFGIDGLSHSRKKLKLYFLI